MNAGLISGQQPVRPDGSIAITDRTSPTAVMPAFGRYVPGREYGTGSFDSSTAGLWSGYIELVLVYVSAPCNFAALGVEVTTAAANTFCGFSLYSAVGNGGWPSTLLWHSGYDAAVTTSSTGLKWFVPGQPLRMSAGAYFLGVRRHDSEAGSIYVRASNNTFSRDLILGETSISGAGLYTAVSTSGVWPSQYQGALGSSPRQVQIYFRTGAV